MKPRYKYINNRWLQSILKVIVHHDDARLNYGSIRNIAFDLFGEIGYSVDFDDLSVGTNGIDHVVTSRLYKNKALPK